VRFCPGQARFESASQPCFEGFQSGIGRVDIVIRTDHMPLATKFEQFDRADPAAQRGMSAKGFLSPPRIAGAIGEEDGIVFPFSRNHLTAHCPRHGDKSTKSLWCCAGKPKRSAAPVADPGDKATTFDGLFAGQFFNQFARFRIFELKEPSAGWANGQDDVMVLIERLWRVDLIVIFRDASVRITAPKTKKHRGFFAACMANEVLNSLRSNPQAFEGQSVLRHAGRRSESSETREGLAAIEHKFSFGIAAAREASTAPGGERLAECWPQLAEIWRLKQLEYSWLRAVADDYKPFWEVTQDGLDYALAALEIDDLSMRETLLGLYQRLSAYPEVPDMLAALKAGGYQTAILSNGSDDMLDSAIESAGIGGVLDASLSVEAVGVFKPHRKVYELVGARMDVEPAEVAFFSSNCWDATHASAFGFQTIWVNRAGNPLDAVGAAPAHIVSDLTAAAALVERQWPALRWLIRLSNGPRKRHRVALRPGRS